MEETKDIARVLEYIACTAADQEHWDRALRVAGAAASLRQKSGFPLSPSSKVILERSLELARQSLPTGDAVTAWMEGSRMTLGQAVAFGGAVDA
jgi:hypothetical protein